MLYSGAMSKIDAYPMGCEANEAGIDARSEAGSKTARIIRTSEQRRTQKNDVFQMVSRLFASNIRTHKIKRARAICVYMRMTGPQTMPLTARSWRHQKLKAREISVRLGTARRPPDGVLRRTPRARLRSRDNVSRDLARLSRTFMQAAGIVRIPTSNLGEGF